MDLMTTDFETKYEYLRTGGTGFYEQKRGLIAVWGKEAVQFLDGLISNDVKTLEDGAQMLAAFPNAQGRLLAVVRVLRQGERFLFDTEEATREKVFNNLFRFTYAGDFFVEDLSDNYPNIEIFGGDGIVTKAAKTEAFSEFYTSIRFSTAFSTICFMPADLIEAFRNNLAESSTVQITDELYELLRIENGVPKYGIDMDETTIVPELGIDDLISYKKGCYIGQEIIARIHFRGHVAKQLTSLVLSEPGAIATRLLHGSELTNADGKNAGRITSVAFSPKMQKTIALAYVRYEHLAEGTKLFIGEMEAKVLHPPFN